MVRRCTLVLPGMDRARGERKRTPAHGVLRCVWSLHQRIFTHERKHVLETPCGLCSVARKSLPARGAATIRRMARKKATRLGSSTAPSCAYTLTLGKRHFRYAPSAYKVCITATQAKALFGTTEKPTPVGCGVFACAFPHPDADKIVKITRDPSDVAGLLQGQGLAQVPKVFDSRELSSQPWWITPRQPRESYQQWTPRPEAAYAIVVEKLRTLKGAEKALWNKRIGRMHAFQKQAAWVARQAEQGTPTQGNRPKPAPPTIGDMAKAVCPKKPAREAKSCQLRVRELNKMTEALRSRGVEWTDIHAGNIGIDAEGRWKALDLGASSTVLKTELPILERATFTRRR